MNVEDDMNVENDMNVEDRVGVNTLSSIMTREKFSPGGMII